MKISFCIHLNMFHDNYDFFYSQCYYIIINENLIINLIVRNKIELLMKSKIKVKFLNIVYKIINSFQDYYINKINISIICRNIFL